MPDNWTFVAAAYTLTAVVLGGYWRWLASKERALNALIARAERAGRSRQPSGPAHPRPEPSSRAPRP